MAVLLVQLVSPLQSWGTSSRFQFRETRMEPSKSGVLGMICSALGRPRNEDVSDLAKLRFGVRVDREPSEVLRDYHTAQDVAKANQKQKSGTVPSERFYLSDAAFLVGLEGDYELLKQIDEALEKPKWQLFLGRKSCPPSAPLRIENGLIDRDDETLETVFQSHPRIDPRIAKRSKLSDAASDDVRAVVETDEEGILVTDQPTSKSYETREFSFRNATTRYFTLPKESYETEVE